MDELQRLLLVFNILGYAFAFILGSVLGSFLGVIIYRVPKKIPFTSGRSFCTECGRKLSAVDLVPVFSYIFLGGKCRTCKAPIPVRCLILELLGAAGAMLCVLRFSYSFEALASFAVICGLIAVAFIDKDTMEIPNGLIIYLLLPAAALVFITPATPILSHVIGAFCISLPLLILAWIIPGSFGGGDIKLMFACGLALGWKNTLLAFFIAVLLGGGYGIYLLAAKKADRKDHFAFGPFLCAGLAAALLSGDIIINFYTGLF